MPILIMTMMTAYAVDNRKVDMRFGAGVSAAVIAAFGLIAIIPTQKDGKITFFGLPVYPEAFWGCLFVSLACAAALIGLVFFMRRDKAYYQRFLFWTISATGVCMAVIIGYGVSMGPYPEQYIPEAIFGEENITLPEDSEETFYRIDLSENYDNYAMSWGMPSMRAFQSVVPSSIMEFYPTVGVTRNVASRAEPEKYGLRGLFSVKYYFNKHAVDSDPEHEFSIPGFEFYDNQNGFDIYENKYFVPMGFTYDYYISEEKYLSQNKSYNDRLLMKALVLTDTQIREYGSLLEEIPSDEMTKLSKEDYLEDCQERAASASTSFEEDTRGFSAEITLDESNLVFFSVPYEKGFTATVDGEPAKLEIVNVGFMAVRVPAGTHEIRFNYMTPGLKAGFALSGVGILLLAGYLFIFRKQKPIHAIRYDYETENEIEAKNAYEQNLIHRIRSHHTKGQ